MLRCGRDVIAEFERAAEEEEDEAVRLVSDEAACSRSRLDCANAASCSSMIFLLIASILSIDQVRGFVTVDFEVCSVLRGLTDTLLEQDSVTVLFFSCLLSRDVGRRKSLEPGGR